jgi:tRNA threonylcarbamoyladenosine biosynthesis protein TsaE
VEYISKSLADTQKIAAELAKKANRRGDVFLLKGNLGAGKTAFAAAFINSLLDAPQNITSPTFNIVQVYKLAIRNQESGIRGGGGLSFPELQGNSRGISTENTTNDKTHNSQEIWHFDLYRLKSADELYEIGLDEALEHGITLIEWPEIAKDFLKNTKTTMVEIELAGDDRVIKVT